MDYFNHENTMGGLRNCTPLLKGIAIVGSSMFAGISFYIQRVDQPSFSVLPTEFALQHWREMYRRVAPIQASLAAVSGVASLLTFVSISQAQCKTVAVKVVEDSVRHCCKCRGWLWGLGGALMLSIIPYTIFCIKPTNDKLFLKDTDPFSDDTRQTLNKWGELHSVRTVLSMTAVGAFFLSVFRHSHPFLHSNK